jgi:hypothetical protein
MLARRTTLVSRKSGLLHLLPSLLCCESISVVGSLKSQIVQNSPHPHTPHPHTRLSSPSVALDFEFSNDMRLVGVCADRERRSTALPSHHHFRHSHQHINNTSGHHINIMPSRQNLCSALFLLLGVCVVREEWDVLTIIGWCKRS